MPTCSKPLFFLHEVTVNFPYTQRQITINISQHVLPAISSHALAKLPFYFCFLYEIMCPFATSILNKQDASSFSRNHLKRDHEVSNSYTFIDFTPGVGLFFEVSSRGVQSVIIVVFMEEYSPLLSVKCGSNLSIALLCDLVKPLKAH